MKYKIAQVVENFSLFSPFKTRRGILDVSNKKFKVLKIKKLNQYKKDEKFRTCYDIGDLIVDWGKLCFSKLVKDITFC